MPSMLAELQSNDEAMFDGLFPPSASHSVNCYTGTSNTTYTRADGAYVPQADTYSTPAPVCTSQSYPAVSSAQVYLSPSSNYLSSTNQQIYENSTSELYAPPSCTTTTTPATPHPPKTPPPVSRVPFPMPDLPYTPGDSFLGMLNDDNLDTETSQEVTLDEEDDDFSFSGLFLLSPFNIDVCVHRFKIKLVQHLTSLISQRIIQI